MVDSYIIILEIYSYIIIFNFLLIIKKKSNLFYIMNNISNDELLYKQKYLKYKSKYTELKQQGGLFGKETTLLFYNKISILFS